MGAVTDRDTVTGGEDPVGTDKGPATSHTTIALTAHNVSLPGP